MATNVRKPKSGGTAAARGRTSASSSRARSARGQSKPPQAGQAAPGPQAEPKAAQGQLDMLLGAAGNTSRVVQLAASILEEELAAGIEAAKRVEQRFVDVGKLRGGNPEEVMQRFRHDAHDVVDILIDMVNLATNSLGGLAQRVVTIGGAKRSSTSAPGAAVDTPSLAIPRPVKAGQSIEVPMTVENASEGPTDALHFHSSDLVSAEGARIPAQQISFAPSDLVIGPHKSEIVKVTVTVPEGTPPGTYAGLLRASKLEQLRALLTVQIE